VVEAEADVEEDDGVPGGVVAAGTPLLLMLSFVGVSFDFSSLPFVVGSDLTFAANRVVGVEGAELGVAATAPPAATARAGEAGVRDDDNDGDADDDDDDGVVGAEVVAAAKVVVVVVLEGVFVVVAGVEAVAVFVVAVVAVDGVVVGF